MRENVVYVVRVHVEREGAYASALFVMPTDEDLSDVIASARSMGIVAEIETDSAPYGGKMSLVRWLEQFDRERTPPPVIERPEYEARLDELTRAQRNTDRKLDRVLEIIERDHGNPMPQPAVANPALRFGIPENSVPQAPQGFAPRVDRNGRGQALESGEYTQGAATRHLTTQATGVGGVLPGNMSLQGGSASSEIWSVGPDGSPVQTALPRVGDSLKPPHLRNGG